MKNSKVYSDKVQKLYRKLQKKYKKPEKPEYEDPVDALVFGVLLENFSEKQALDGIKEIDRHFVDYNDLRVASAIETAEVLDGSAQAKKAGIELYHALNAIFVEHNCLSLKHLLKTGKRQAKANLEKYEQISHFVANYIALTALDAHAIALNEAMINYLRENELVNPESDEADIEGFLTRLVSADDTYDFYVLLRRESEGSKLGLRSSSTPKTKKTSKSHKKTTKKAKKTRKKAKKTKTKK